MPKTAGAKNANVLIVKCHFGAESTLLFHWDVNLESGFEILTLCGMVWIGCIVISDESQRVVM